jgi:hypothetical protein
MKPVSIGRMLISLSGMIGTKDLNNWETELVQNCMLTSKDGTLTAHLSGPQVEKIEEIYQKHFA